MSRVNWWPTTAATSPSAHQVASALVRSGAATPSPAVRPRIAPPGLSRSFQLLCRLGEPGQSRTPELLERMQPLTQLRQRFRGQAVDAPAALRLVGHEPGVAQNFEVLRDGRAAELEPVAEFSSGQGPPSEDLEQLPPHGIRQRKKDANPVRRELLEILTRR